MFVVFSVLPFTSTGEGADCQEVDSLGPGCHASVPGLAVFRLEVDPVFSFSVCRPEVDPGFSFSVGPLAKDGCAAALSPTMTFDQKQQDYTWRE